MIEKTHARSHAQIRVRHALIRKRHVQTRVRRALKRKRHVRHAKIDTSRPNRRARFILRNAMRLAPNRKLRAQTHAQASVRRAVHRNRRALPRASRRPSVRRVPNQRRARTANARRATMAVMRSASTPNTAHQARRVRRQQSAERAHLCAQHALFPSRSVARIRALNHGKTRAYASRNRSPNREASPAARVSAVSRLAASPHRPRDAADDCRAVRVCVADRTRSHARHF